jgi:hypothetical protein
LVVCYHFFSVNCCFILCEGCKAEMYRKHTDSVWRSSVQDGLHGLCAGVLSVPSWCFRFSLISHCLTKICYCDCFAEACRLRCWYFSCLCSYGWEVIHLCPLLPFEFVLCLGTQLAFSWLTKQRDV